LPRSYRDALQVNALRGARIGLLRNLFGRDEADEEVNQLVRSALEAMKGLGAVVVEIQVDGLDGPLENSLVIDTEFKFDFLDYLSNRPNATVHSLSELLEHRAFHASLEKKLRRRDEPATRDSESERRALANQDTVRRLVIDALNGNSLDALAYPTVNRRAATIGEAQAGVNCQLSPAAGLPALAVPAGFTEDGLPVGM